MEDKQSKVVIIISLFIIGGIFSLIYFFLLINPMIETLKTYEGSEYVVVTTTIRIFILLIMSIFMFHQWFKQEHQYFSDIPFLFGLFFTLILFGKFFDIYYSLTYYTAEYNLFLIIYKSRYIIALLSLSPMYYLSVGMLLFYYSLYKDQTELRNEPFLKRIQKIITIIIILLEIVIVLTVLNEKTGPLILSLIVLTSLLVITITFYLVYKNKRLSQVNPKILTIGFGAYLISQVVRSILHIIMGNTPLTVASGEIIDIFVFLIIFTGLITKIKYR